MRRDRRFVAIATAEYEATAPLPAVPSEVKVLRDWLCADALGERGFQPHAIELADNPDKTMLRAVFESPLPGAGLRPHHQVVLYITGHGEIAHGTLWFLLRDSRSDRLHRTAQSAAELFGWLIEHDIEHLLAIVDVCHAGALGAPLLANSGGVPPGWTIMLTTTPAGTAASSLFTSVLSEFLDEAARGVHGKEPFLSHRYVIEQLELALYRRNQQPSVFYRSFHQIALLPNPGYQADTDPPVEVAPARGALALRQRDLNVHWAPKAAGATTDWLFTGRAELMRRLVEFTVGQPGALVVTGAAGTGKSAALGRLVTLSDPGFRARHLDRLADVPPDLLPDESAVDVAVLAAGKTVEDVLHQLHEDLRCESADPAFEPQLAAVNNELNRRAGRATVVLDALDEATDPTHLLNDLLVRLAPLRLVVGVRSATGDSRNGLAGQVTAVLDADVVTIDTSPYWRDDDLRHYTEALLRRASPASEPAEITATAELAAKASGKSYLAARIITDTLTAEGDLSALDSRAWIRLVNAGPANLLRAELLSEVPDTRQRRRAVALLRALAFAKGPGLPRQRVWPAIATALNPGGPPIVDADIAWLLEHRLAAYLIRDTADGITVYRLFHAALADALREYPSQFIASESADG